MTQLEKESFNVNFIKITSFWNSSE